MSFVLRLFLLVAMVSGLVVFLFFYRRRTNTILAIVVGSYVLTVGVRLLTVENEADLLLHTVLALGGLGVLWGAVWLGARWAQKAGWLDRD